MRRDDRSTNVHCYSGHTSPERPVSFFWDGAERQVQSVVKEWREPGHRYFRVRIERGRTFVLCYDVKQDKWSVTESL